MLLACVSMCFFGVTMQRRTNHVCLVKIYEEPHSVQMKKHFWTILAKQKACSRCNYDDAEWLTADESLSEGVFRVHAGQRRWRLLGNQFVFLHCCFFFGLQTWGIASADQAALLSIRHRHMGANNRNNKWAIRSINIRYHLISQLRQHLW